MKPRTLIILGVVLAVLFVVGIGVGAGGGHGSPIKFSDYENASLDQFLTRKLDPVHDMTLQSGTNCVVQPAQIAIPLNATCSYQVGSTFIPLKRRLTLTILDNAQLSFTLVLKMDHLDPVSTTPVPTGQTVSMDIYQAGGTLTITCVSASSGTCTMRVG